MQVNPSTLETNALEQAMNLFWKNGFKATSEKELSAIFNEEWPVILSRYGSKREIFQLAFRLYLKKNTDFIREYLNQQNSVKEGFRQLMVFAVEESIADPDSKGCFVINSVVELVPGDPEMMLQFMENKMFIENIFIDFLEKGVISGELDRKMDLRTTAAFLYTNYSGIKVIAKVNKNRPELYGIINTTIKVLD